MRAVQYNIEGISKLFTVVAILSLTVVALSTNVMAQSGGGPCPACKIVHPAASINFVDSYTNRVVPVATWIEQLVAASEQFPHCMNHLLLTTSGFPVSN